MNFDQCCSKVAFHSGQIYTINQKLTELEQKITKIDQKFEQLKQHVENKLNEITYKIDLNWHDYIEFYEHNFPSLERKINDHILLCSSLNQHH